MVIFLQFLCKFHVKHFLESQFDRVISKSMVIKGLYCTKDDKYGKKKILPHAKMRYLIGM